MWNGARPALGACYEMRHNNGTEGVYSAADGPEGDKTGQHTPASRVGCHVYEDETLNQLGRFGDSASRC